MSTQVNLKRNEPNCSILATDKDLDFAFRLCGNIDKSRFVYFYVRQRGGRKVSVRALIVGIAGGALTAFIAWSSFIPDPLAFHSVTLAVIGAIYIGFAFSDGRLSIIILELSVATAFIVLALLGLWLVSTFIAIGLILHGFWDLAHRPRGITTKLPSWYPPFCAAFDFLFAGVFLLLARELGSRAP
jgi:hypothetical protein